MTIAEKLKLMDAMKARNAQRVREYLGQRGCEVQPCGEWPNTIEAKGDKHDV